MDNPFNNPILLLFLSYAIGALVNIVILNSSWYDRLTILNFLSDRTSERIGVLVIRKLMTKTILGNFNPKISLSGRGTNEKLTALRREMSSAEVGHLIGFVAILIVCLVYILYSKSWLLTVGLFSLNVFFNLYMVLLQQYS